MSDEIVPIEIIEKKIFLIRGQPACRQAGK
jgi:hypothetical protein